MDVTIALIQPVHAQILYSHTVRFINSSPPLYIYIYIWRVAVDMQDTAGEARTNSAVMYSFAPPHMAKQKQGDQLEHDEDYINYSEVLLFINKRT